MNLKNNTKIKTRIEKKELYKLLDSVFFECPEHGEKPTIIKVEFTSKSIVVYTRGKSSQYKHTIKTEEI